jgi:hypothetical protein
MGKASNKTKFWQKKIAEELGSKRKSVSTLLNGRHVTHPAFLWDFFVCKWDCSYVKKDLRSTEFKEWIWVLKRLEEYGQRVGWIAPVTVNLG